MGKSSTTWKPGQSGNPKGRPRGSRDTINEAFLKDLAEDWQKHGAASLRKAREERPAEYCRMVANLLPKDQHLKVENEQESPFLEILKRMGSEAKLTKEIAGLKEENARLKGAKNAPDNQPAPVE